MAVAIDWNKVIEQSLAMATVVIPAVVAGIIKLRKLEKGQQRIEQKADGNHKAALEEIKKAGKYEGKEEAKHDARYDREQLLALVEQVMAVQAKQRGRRRSDPP